ncbi:MAG: hypothetical protein ABL921_17505 [Pirellula sp.]
MANESEFIEFEFDRKKLLQYLRIQAIAGCCGVAILPSLMMTSATYSFWCNPHIPFAMVERIGWFLISLVVGLVVGLSIAMAFYLFYFRATARLESENRRLMVEGAFVRVVSGSFIVTDRRIHFREIGDYCTHQGPLLRRLGMTSLSFCQGGSRNQFRTTIAGLVNAQLVRDQLCELDRQRE